MTNWKDRFDHMTPKQENTVDRILIDVYRRAAACIPDDYVILSVSYQLFVEGTGEYQYLLSIGKLGDSDVPEIIGQASACFDKMPGPGVIEKWIAKIEKVL